MAGYGREPPHRTAAAGRRARRQTEQKEGAGEFDSEHKITAGGPSEWLAGDPGPGLRIRSAVRLRDSAARGNARERGGRSIGSMIVASVAQDRLSLPFLVHLHYCALCAL